MPTKFVSLPVSQAHRLIEPGPVVMVSTRDEQGANLMTNGFNMPVSHGAEMAIVVGEWDYSFRALRDTGECVIALPGRDILERVVDVGNVSGSTIDKWARFGFTQDQGEVVDAPLVQECFANIECTVADDRMVGTHALWILRMQRAWIDPAAAPAPEVHHRGDGTFSTNGHIIDLRDRMTKWQSLTAD